MIPLRQLRETEGLIAAQAEQPASANSYDEGTDDRAWWAEGWNGWMTRKDEERE